MKSVLQMYHLYQHPEVQLSRASMHNKWAAKLASILRHNEYWSQHCHLHTDDISRCNWTCSFFLRWVSSDSLIEENRIIATAKINKVWAAILFICKKKRIIFDFFCFEFERPGDTKQHYLADINDSVKCCDISVLLRLASGQRQMNGKFEKLVMIEHFASSFSSLQC